MSDWKIGLSAWIVQDGNYGDFRRHERAEFALEFYAQDCQPSSSSESPLVRWIVARALAPLVMSTANTSTSPLLAHPHSTRTGEFAGRSGGKSSIQHSPIGMQASA